MKDILNESFMSPDQKYRSVEKKEGGGWKWWFLSSLQKYCIEMQYIFLSEQDCFCHKKFHQKPGAKGPKYKFCFICKREDNNLDRTANITACRGECDVTVPSMCVGPFSFLVSWPEWLCSSVPSLEPSPTESTFSTNDNLSCQKSSL